VNFISNHLGDFWTTELWSYLYWEWDRYHSCLPTLYPCSCHSSSLS